MQYSLPGVLQLAMGLSSHGYWLRQSASSLYCPDPFPATVPPLLVQELKELEDTGTVVGVVGFKRIRKRAEGG